MRIPKGLIRGIRRVLDAQKSQRAAAASAKASQAPKASEVSKVTKMESVSTSPTMSAAAKKKQEEEEKARSVTRKIPRLPNLGVFKEGGSVRKRAAGSPPKGETRYEVLGRPVTKEQYDAASKEMDRPKSKVEEDMDDFAKKAKERAKMKAKGMKSGGMADKTGRAMKKTTADAKGRAMTKAPKKMMGGGMAKYAKGGSVACGPATRGYGAARKSK